MKKRTERIESPKGFFARTKTTNWMMSLEEIKNALKAATPGEEIRSMVGSYRETANTIISRAGRDPAQWESILGSDSADRSWCAAKVLEKLAAFERELVLMEDELDRAKSKEYAQRAMHRALQVAFYYRALAIVQYEAAIDSRLKSIGGGPLGAIERTTVTRDIELAKECMAHKNWPGDRARIIRNVIVSAGLKYDTGRKAIARGLKANKKVGKTRGIFPTS